MAVGQTNRREFIAGRRLLRIFALRAYRIRLATLPHLANSSRSKYSEGEPQAAAGDHLG